jgi:hypothetical protein
MKGKDFNFLFSTFSGRHMKIRYGRSLSGERIVIDNQTPLNEKVNLFLMTSIDEKSVPCFYRFNQGNTDQFVFTNFIMSAIENNFLTPGDVLFLDNATYHHGGETIELLQFFLELLDIKLINLPKFSPEYNPCVIY